VVAFHDPVAEVIDTPDFPDHIGSASHLDTYTEGHIVVYHRSGTVRGWDLTGPSPRATDLNGKGPEIRRLTIAPDGRLVTNSVVGVVEVRDPSKTDDPPNAAAPQPDVGWCRTILGIGRPTGTLPFGGCPSAVSVGPTAVTTLRCPSGDSPR